MKLISDIDHQESVMKEIEGMIPLCIRAGEFALHEEKIDHERVEVGLTVTDKAVIKELNRDYRSTDETTDVLSFPQYANADEVLLDMEDSGRDIILGDVVICYERACEQASDYGHDLRREFVYLFTHSMFHLLGYDHMNEDEKKIMREKEETVMNRLLLARQE
jgi:probable rRNA maturation factor